MKWSSWLLAAGSVCLLLAALPARANPGRTVYVNGDNYQVSIDGGYITVRKGGPTAILYDIWTSPYKVCRTYNKVPGESLAVFDDKIYYAYTADTPANYIVFGQDTQSTSCSNPGHGMSVWVMVFDVAKRDTAPWVSNRALGAVNIKYQTSSASGAAITVFNNKLYVFTDLGIYTSADGSQWEGPHPALENSGWEPLDAITIYIPYYNQGSRIFIVYGLQTSSANLYYSSLWGATWNGEFDEKKVYMANPSPPFPYGSQQQILGSVSLSTGTASFDGWGAKEAAAQLFMRAKVGSTNVIQHLEFTFGNSLGQWRVDPTTYGTSVTSLLAWITSKQECTVPNYWDLRQEFYLTWFSGSSRQVKEVMSDALAPHNRDIPITSCGDPGGTETNMMEPDLHDPEVLKTRENYWTLVGVILGSPPFAQNGYKTPAEFSLFSNVTYGKDSSHAVEETQSMSNAVLVSAGTEVHAGLENVAGAGVKIDASYKHAWESSNGETVTKSLKSTEFMGTQQAACTDMGKKGWAVFMAPKVVYQDWKAYAWNYNPDTGEGGATPLNLDLHTIKVKEVAEHPEASFQTVYAAFDLEDPGGEHDDYPGLMKGMKPFRNSLNTKFWYVPAYTWKGPDPRWETKLGENDLIPLEFGAAHANEETYTSSTQSFDSSGATNDISFSETASFSVGSKINGMSGYLTVGYAGSFKTNTKSTTGFSDQVVFSLRSRTCNYPGPTCLNSLAVQPYWLLAKDRICDTEEDRCRAPWIPTAFKNQKPWAITWKVTNANPIGGLDIAGPTCLPQSCTTSADCTALPNTYCMNPTGVPNAGACTTPPLGSLVSRRIDPLGDDSRAGTALPPVQASGRVVSGMGGGDGGEPTSHYAIQGGRLSWFLGGTEERIPMTAGDFDPSMGVSFQIQELTWSLTAANGAWTRAGDVWTFQPKANENRASMTIDFGKASYDLHIQKLDLSGRVPAGTTILRLLVTVNEKYMFYTDMQHDVNIAWRWNLPAPNAVTLHVTSIEGRHDTGTKTGKASIAGTLPANLPAFGDVELNVNQHPFTAQLVGLEDFQQAVQNGGSFKYSKEGLILSFDFGRKTWSATFNGKAFHELLVPQIGMLRTKLSVGGLPWYQADDAVLDYSANLKLRK